MQRKVIKDTLVLHCVSFAVCSVLLLCVSSCTSSDNGRRAITMDTTTKRDNYINSEDERYTVLLDGLDKSYVLAVEQEPRYKSDLLKFFRVDDQQFTEDSAVYHQAVKNFYEQEKEILAYLLQFENDTLTCGWLGQEQPFSSKFDVSSLYRHRRQIAALVLMYNYLGQTNSTIYEKYWVVVPDTLSCPPHTMYVDYRPFRQWYEQRHSLLLEALRREFTRNPPPHIVIQCRTTSDNEKN